jgi:hypothetical protein
MAYRPERGWGFGGHGEANAQKPSLDELGQLKRRVEELEKTLKAGDR